MKRSVRLPDSLWKANNTPELRTQWAHVEFLHLAWNTDDIKAQTPTLFLCLSENLKNQIAILQKALSAGAALCLAKDLKIPSQKQTLYLEHFLFQDTIGQVSRHFFNHPAEEMNLWGITGTNGKTTTSWLLYHLLQQKRKCGLIGTTGWYGPNRKQHALPWTTPESPVLQQLFSDFKEQGVHDVAMEVSSHGIAEKRIAGCVFRGAAFTNLTQDHLDYHPDMEHYFQTKQKLFLDHTNTDSYSVICVDDAYGQRLHRTLKEKKRNVITYGTAPQSDVRVQILRESLEGVTFTCTLEHGTYEFQSSLLGTHNALNLTAAFTLLCAKGDFSWNELQPLSSLLTAPRGRLERVTLSRSPFVFVDYAHTPDALEKALKTLHHYKKPEQLITVVFGCGGDRDATKRPLMGAVAARLADTIILTTDNSRSENPQSIINNILQGIPKERKATVILDRAEAIAQAVTQLKKNHILIVAGKGHETTQTDAHGVRHFSDQEELLKHL